MLLQVRFSGENPAHPPHFHHNNREFQPTLPARGATQAGAGHFRLSDFNPRSPHGERQLVDIVHRRRCVGFQSTLPARGATTVLAMQRAGVGISIHAPRTGSDAAAGQHGSAGRYFNPRSPHGERHERYSLNIAYRYFNPRSPHGERPIISAITFFLTYFNPRSPHGERRAV